MSEDHQRYDKDGNVYEKKGSGYEQKWDAWAQQPARKQVNREQNPDGYLLDGTPLYRKQEESGSSGGADVIGDVVGGAAVAGLLAIALIVSGPLDRWLMRLAMEQSERPEELEEMVPSIQGLNYW